MGLALGRQLAAAGHDVLVGSRDPERAREKAEAIHACFGGSYGAAAAGAEAVILAVPWQAVPQTLDVLGDLAGTILIDVTNPFKEGGADEQHEYAGSSGAELIQEMEPQARVVKAWNHVYSAILRRPPDFGGTIATVFVAGDDSEAKEVVMGLISDIGWEPADAGPLSSARYLEPLAALMTSLDRNSGGEVLHALKLLRGERVRAGGSDRDRSRALASAGTDTSAG